ncbi:mutS protein homolog 4-like [Chelonus insularis]|uniref:mutS protein homolog 4-like n=1 Tax=Chelonus insularis TaxID=460826 RepID=UPI0015885287|nr:mutS protein homolog 4-like [Chelonus insularis]
MNVINHDNVLGLSKGRGRNKNRKKVGALDVNVKSTVNILPKYQLLDIRKPLVNFGPSSSTTVTPKSSRRGRITTSSSSKKSSAKKTTDSEVDRTTTSGSISDDYEAFVIIAVTCGRGEARGEVGLAAVDVQYPHMILCQISDYNSYINTLTKIHSLNPVEIIMPDTMCESGHNLYSAIHEKFQNIPITGVQRIHFNDIIGLERIRTHCATEYSSVEIIANQKYYALAAVAALMKYIEFIQHTQYLPKSMNIEFQGSQNGTIIDIDSAQKLELVVAQGGQPKHCLLGALDRCSTPMGRRLLRASILQPPCNQDFIEARLSCVEELVSNRSLFEIIRPIIRRLFGASRLLSLAMYSPQANIVLRAERNLNYILLLKNIVDIVPEFRTALNTAQAPFFKKVMKDLEDEVFDKIKQRILSIVHDDARAVMGYTSSNMQRCFAIKPGINDILDVARQTYCELIDDMKSMVNELGVKYNLPLSLECNSAWGYHIEMNVGRRDFDINNLPEEFIHAKKYKNSILMTTEQLIVLSIHCDEASEELHIMSDVLLKSALDDIREYIGCLFLFNDNVAELDLIMALSQISSITDYVKPTFGVDLELRNSKHPVMDVFNTESPTPNDVVASVQYNFHTITGPNMSGKTIYLKQIVLLQIMAQLGCYVPATKAKFRITDHIFCKIGARDDIENNASTFMLEMKEAQFMLQSVTPSSLIIIDELARSTTVEEGASIAWAICEELSCTSAFTFNATHFLQLLKMADLYPNVTNHYLEAILNEKTNSDDSRLVYTHHLKQGVSVIEHYGLKLARSTGLPENILRNSQKLATDLSQALQPMMDKTSEQDTQIILQRKKNYDTLAVIYQELQKKDTNTERISEMIRDLKYIQEDEALISLHQIQEAQSALTENNDTKKKSIKQTLSLRSNNEGFKKPHPVTTPKSGEESLVLTQSPSHSSKRTSSTNSSLAPKPKIFKIERLKDSTFFLSDRNIYEKKNGIFAHTPEEVRKILKNPLTDPNSPLYLNSPKTSERNKKLSNESTSFENANHKIKSLEKLSSTESPFFIPHSESSQLKKKVSRHAVHSVQSYVPEQYADLQKAIRTIKRTGLSQENDADDDQSKTTSTSELLVIDQEYTPLKELINHSNRSNQTSPMNIFGPPEKKTRMNIPMDNIPEQYSYMRHILKNVSWKMAGDTSQSNKFKRTSDAIDECVVVSESVSRAMNIPSNDCDEVNKIEELSKSLSESSIITMMAENSNYFHNLHPDPTETNFLFSQPSRLDFSVSGPSNMSYILRNMSSSSSLYREISPSTTAACISARKKEAEIFKIIEGDSFDENRIMGSVKSFLES